MSRFSILVTTSPFESDRGFAAQRFIEDAIRTGNEIDHVFFYQDGVYHSNRFNTQPNDEYDTLSRWKSLKKAHQLRLIVCITAASKRGVVSNEVASELDIPSHNLDDEFEQAGLGEFFTALHNCDTLVQF